MGTLTADTPRLAEYCDHKLPTSCRLTSIPNCCACADERAHSASYRTYIDGIGFVPRGTRWQRYCWFCKEFWENRVAVTNLLPAQTRIPEVPDQTDFLKRWYDFYQGYRIVRGEDGSEETIALLGEPFRDVAPGVLPRTLDELRAGRERSAADQTQHIVVDEGPADTGPTLDETLDQMFAAAAAEEDSHARPPLTAAAAEDVRADSARPVAGQVMQATGSRSREYQVRRISALRRELHRMRNGIERVISGLRDLGEAVPDYSEATERLTSLGRTLDNMNDDVPVGYYGVREARVGPPPSVHGDPTLATPQQRLDRAQSYLAQAQRYRDQCAQELNTAQASLVDARRNREDAAEALEGAEIDLAEHRTQISQLRREQSTIENYTRIFGTREDMELQGANWESPIGGMFTRAWERFRVAEEVRREERTLRHVLEDERRAQEHGQDADDVDDLAANTTHEDQLNEYYTMLRQQNWTQPTRPDPDNFPGNMLNAVRTADSRGLTATQSSDSGVTSGQGTNTSSTATRATGHLERLLRNTPEPERSAIIARMVDNGTAQALEGVTTPFPESVWSRLQRSALEYTHTEELDDDDDDEDDGTGQGLDVPDSGRPDAKEDEELTMKLDCKICYTQVADTACLPCGHLAMCQWCSDQHSPTMLHDRTRPRRTANCPVCRKKIKQKVRIYRP